MPGTVLGASRGLSPLTLVALQCTWHAPRSQMGKPRFESFVRPVCSGLRRKRQALHSALHSLRTLILSYADRPASQLWVLCKPDRRPINHTDETRMRSEPWGALPMVPPPTVPYPVGSADTMHLTVNRLTILLLPPAAQSLPCPSSYGSGCWHLCHPTGPQGQVLGMEKPFLRYGQASPAIVPPQEGDSKPEDQERQLSWDRSGSEHPPTPTPRVRGFFSPVPSAPGGSAHLFHSALLPNRGRPTAEQACTRAVGRKQDEQNQCAAQCGVGGGL